MRKYFDIPNKKIRNFSFQLANILIFIETTAVANKQ